MKRLTVMLVLASAVASTAWFIWALVTERAVAAWLAEREAAGWVVATEGVSVEGFPASFVTVLESVELADPSTGWAWSAPRFTFEQAVLDPGRVQAVWPVEQRLASPHERLTITAADLRSALELQPVNNLALDASETAMAGLLVESSTGWQMSLARGQADMVRQEGTEAIYALRFSASDLVPPAQVISMIDPAGVLPETIPVVVSDAVVTFDRAWDLSAIESARPQPTRIELTEARAEWGDLLFRTSGSLDIDAEGRASGDLALRAENWEEMLDMAIRAEVLGEGLAGTVRAALSFLAGLSGRPENLDATLRLEDGFMYVGPLAVGEAPRLLLR